MKLLGLTGGVGMGKSTSAELLRAQGCEVADTDVIAREMVRPGTAALKEIENVFGSEFINEAGELKRRELAELVFSDAEAKRGLERILHPRVRTAWLATVAEWRTAQVKVGVVVIPLLFETAAEREFDAIISVGCALKTQKARLIERGWGAEEIERRIAAQLSSAEKMARADWVVWSEGALWAHQKQLERILALGV